jgi:hypothetical protein
MKPQQYHRKLSGPALSDIRHVQAQASISALESE